MESSVKRRNLSIATGISAFAVVSGGVTLCLIAHPDYDPLTEYISQLAGDANPLRHVFGGTLIVGGALFTLFARTLKAFFDDDRTARWGLGLATVAGVCMALVGIFPLHVPIPHFLSAFVMFASMILAEIFLSRALATMARRYGSAALRRGSYGLLGLFGLHIAATLFGFIYSGIVTLKMPWDSMEQVLHDAASYQTLTVGSITTNPVALLEWLFLLSTMGLPLAGALGVALTRKAVAESEAN